MMTEQVESLETQKNKSSITGPKPSDMTRKEQVNLEASWLKFLENEFKQDYMKQIKAYLIKRSKQGAIIYPKASNLFAALNACPLDKVKCVILGQDPYHGPGQAHGLSFSVPEGIRIPPSLLNIFKEICRSNPSQLKPEQIQIPKSGNLSYLAEQGVVLLNASLTVEKAAAGSHAKIGWQHFTDRVIEIINQNSKPCVFLLWGSYARGKKLLINPNQHLVLEAPHPSPLSAHRGFIGCNHFSLANQFLAKKGRGEIQWLPN